MKVNFKLKNLCVEHINTIEQDKEYFSVFGISFEEKDNLLQLILDSLSDECFLVYEKGNTQYIDKLYVIYKNDILKYFSEKYMIYSLDSLDSIQISEYDDSPYSSEGIEVNVTGKFVEILEPIIKKFKYDVDESRLPPQLKETIIRD